VRVGAAGALQWQMVVAVVSAESPARPPLTPDGCDLTNFLRMPLVVGRLLSSETWIEAGADPRLGHVLVCLWCEAWRQVPAASLPDSDATLQRMSMCPSAKEWKRVRERVLAGWVRCSDGRLYHPVVAEMALECWLEKLAQRRSSAAGNAKRHGLVFDPRAIDASVQEARGMLTALNEHSQALAKRRALGSVSPVPNGSRREPGGSPGGTPTGSQGNGRDISPKPPSSACGQVFGSEPAAGMPGHVREQLAALLPGGTH
jgi:Protein of unknown function (DUF1376)